jgi:hypothetical protein
MAAREGGVGLDDRDGREGVQPAAGLRRFQTTQAQTGRGIAHAAAGRLRRPIVRRFAYGNADGSRSRWGCVATVIPSTVAHSVGAIMVAGST